MKKISLFIMIFFIFQLNCDDKKYKLLIKIASRGRPKRFFSTLDKYYENLSGSQDIETNFLISLDLDDPQMNNEEIINKLKQYKKLKFFFDKSKNKVHACNRDIEKYKDPFDILLLASDDMIPIKKNYDSLIISKMMKHFPNLDGIINFNDGYSKNALVTLPVMGRNYYNTYGYIYHPGYQSEYCDLELLLKAKEEGKIKQSKKKITVHEHPSISANAFFDDTYKKNMDPQILTEDKILIRKRLLKNFDSEKDLIFSTRELYQKSDDEIIWSILIPTLKNRNQIFEPLFLKLVYQIEELRLHSKIEILFYLDNKTKSVGEKRNSLVEKSKGRYISFVDDDDDVSDDYIKLIYEKLITNPDCVSLSGIITINGLNPKKFLHSIQFSNWFESDNIYYRCPNHLNPIKKAIAAQFKFPETNHGEDFDWSIKIRDSKLLKSEAYIEKPYYFYKFVSNK